MFEQFVDDSDPALCIFGSPGMLQRVNSNSTHKFSNKYDVAWMDMIMCVSVFLCIKEAPKKSITKHTREYRKWTALNFQKRDY